MKVVIEKTKVTRKGSIKVSAWHSGVLRDDIYVEDPRLHCSRAKYFIRNRLTDQVKVVKGQTFLNPETNVLYFVESKTQQENL